jgi:hypothetical protein
LPAPPTLFQSHPNVAVDPQLISPLRVMIGKITHYTGLQSDFTDEKLPLNQLDMAIDNTIKYTLGLWKVNLKFKFRLGVNSK